MKDSSWNFPARAAGWTRRCFLLLAGLLLAAAAAGCGRKKSDVGGELPVMPVSHPIARVVTDYADFTGRTDAKFSVNIVARVTGYLVPVEKPVKQASEAKEADPAVNRQEGGYAFKEGSEVKKGDLLFLIDPRPYQAQYDQAQARSRSTRRNSIWRRPLWRGTRPSTRTRPAPSANRHWTSIRPRSSRPRPACSRNGRAWKSTN